mmetsp:Transcript_9026/g.22493  ORF Transcript_9026/g.22493 Transcript_9026/m.22493 type:complete len:450 (+) Transcript_9026:611-1960(+)
MQRDELHVLRGDVRVALAALLMCDVHEVSGEDTAGDVVEILRAAEFGRNERDVELLHQARELRPNIVGRTERSLIEVVVPAPLTVAVVVLIRMICVEQSNVVATGMNKLGLCRIRSLLLRARPHEAVPARNHSHDAEHLVRAIKRRRGQESLCQLRLEGKPRHHPPDLCEIPVVIQRPQVVQQLEGAHERLGRGRVHEIEVHEVVDAHALQMQDHRPQIRPQNLRIRRLLQLRVERDLRIQPKTLPRPRPPRAPRALLRARLGYRAHEQRLHADARVVHLLLREARVDDVHDALDRERRLGNVGGDDDLAAARAAWAARRGRGVEDALLAVRGEGGVEGEDDESAAGVGVLRAFFEDGGAGVLDFFLAGEEEEDVALGLGGVDLDDGPDGSLDVVVLGLGGVEYFDGVHPALDVHDGGVVKVLGELAGVQGGGHDDELELRAAADELLE